MTPQMFLSAPQADSTRVSRSNRISRLRAIAPKDGYSGLNRIVLTLSVLVGVLCAVFAFHVAAHTIHLPPALLFDIPLYMKYHGLIHVSSHQVCVAFCGAAGLLGGFAISATTLYLAISAVLTRHRRNL